MRKLLLIVMAAAVAAVTVVLAAPARAASGDARVNGVGTLGNFGDPTVLVSATEFTSALTGGRVLSGVVVLTYPDGTTVSGNATCLTVSGTTAYVTASISLAEGARAQAENWSVGNYIVVGVQDNRPVSPDLRNFSPGPASPDLLNFSPGFAANPGCGPNGAATPVFPIVKGHYRVKGG